MPVPNILKRARALAKASNNEIGDVEADFLNSKYKTAEGIEERNLANGMQRTILSKLVRDGVLVERRMSSVKSYVLADEPERDPKVPEHVMRVKPEPALRSGELEIVLPGFFAQGEALAKLDWIFASWWDNRPGTFDPKRAGKWSGPIVPVATWDVDETTKIPSDDVFGMAAKRVNVFRFQGFRYRVERDEHGIPNGMTPMTGQAQGASAESVRRSALAHFLDLCLEGSK